MLDANQAVRAARRALRAVFAEDRFAIAALKDPLKSHETWVFRCKARGAGPTVVCKLSTADATGRARIRVQYDRLRSVRAHMDGGRLTVPEPLALVEAEAALLMRHVEGTTLARLLPDLPGLDEAAPYLEAAGGWLAAFQRPTLRQSVFDPKPHLNWLSKRLSGAAGQTPLVPDPERFGAAFDRLALQADACKGLPSLRCVTHRDFHLGNVIFAKDGGVCGLDLENHKEDDALRDVVSFLFDLVVRGPAGPDDFARYQAAAATFWRAYGDRTTAPAVLSWFQTFSALAAWAGLAGRADLNATRRHKLQRLQALALSPLILPDT